MSAEQGRRIPPPYLEIPLGYAVRARTGASAPHAHGSPCRFPHILDMQREGVSAASDPPKVYRPSPPHAMPSWVSLCLTLLPVGYAPKASGSVRVAKQDSGR